MNPPLGVVRLRKGLTRKDDILDVYVGDEAVASLPASEVSWRYNVNDGVPLLTISFLSQHAEIETIRIGRAA